MVFGGIFPVLFWGVLIAPIVWGIKQLTDRGGTAQKNKPLDIAREQYAKGEILKEESDKIKKDLS